MEYLSVNGKRKLGGSLTVHGAKNSVLPILAATVLIGEETVIHNCPQLSDVENTVKVLRYLGAAVNCENNTITVNAKAVNKNDIPEALMKEMRSSIIFLGALCGVMQSACLFLPGGCDIGQRPIDIHLKGFAELSGIIRYEGDIICADMRKAKACQVVLPFPSVGATENLILAAVLLKGKTTLINAAREPEITDLCRFLNLAGAKINGAGTNIIEIEGVSSLHAVEYTVMPDRILAATMMCAAAITGSELFLNQVSLPDLAPVLPVFMEIGCDTALYHNGLRIQGPEKIRRVKKLVTRPYPGFPTDCQAPVSAVLTLGRGTSIISETIFENRFRHMPQLQRFGADITLDGQLAVINGVKRLYASRASCTDLRGGAAVVLAALAAEGTSQIDNLFHLDRGYERLELQLSSIGADIKRIKNEKEKYKHTSQQNTA